MQSLNCGSKHFIITELSSKASSYYCTISVAQTTELDAINVKAMGSVLMESMR